MRRTGQPPGADVSMLKIKGTEIQQGAHRADDAGGRARSRSRSGRSTATPASTSSPRALAPRYCNFRKTTIYAGSNEIQRNIIAKMTLGL